MSENSLPAYRSTVNNSRKIRKIEMVKFPSIFSIVYLYMLGYILFRLSFISVMREKRLPTYLSTINKSRNVGNIEE